jgi:hypothetical protein
VMISAVMLFLPVTAPMSVASGSRKTGSGTVRSPAFRQIDLSGNVIRTENGEFVMSAANEGSLMRAQDAMVNINDKRIVVGLQSGNFATGVTGSFQADRGGQWLMYQPKLPVA